MDFKNSVIEIATDDGTTVSSHFGRARFYEVLNFSDGRQNWGMERTPCCDACLLGCSALSFGGKCSIPMVGRYDYKSPLDGLIRPIKMHSDDPASLSAPVSLPVVDDVMISNPQHDRHRTSSGTDHLHTRQACLPSHCQWQQPFAVSSTASPLPKMNLGCGRLARGAQLTQIPTRIRFFVSRCGRCLNVSPKGARPHAVL